MSQTRSTREVRLQPGTLWSAVVERSRQARASGALSPIETEQQTIDDAGVQFVLRSVSTLAREAAQRPAKRNDGPSSSNTFPMERELRVADVSDTHIALLNKFPVIPYHVLLVTRQNIPQEALLDRADFAALGACLSEYDALGLYNGDTPRTLSRT